MRHNFKTLSDLYEYASVRYAKRTASVFTDGSQAYTYTRFKETADNLSRILCNFGVSAFDKVAILSENMPHWGIAFFAVTAYGRVAVPMLNELSASEVESILDHSEAKALFVSRRQLKKVSDTAMAKLSLVIDIDDFSFIKHDDLVCPHDRAYPLRDDYLRQALYLLLERFPELRVRLHVER